MNNCIKRALCAKVNNDKLPYYGKISLIKSITTNANQALMFKNNATSGMITKEILTEGVNFYNKTTNKSSDDQVHLPESAPIGTKVVIYPMPDIQTISLAGNNTNVMWGDFKTWNLSNSLTSITITNAYQSYATGMMLKGNGIEMSTKDLGKYTALTTLNIAHEGENFTGNIEDLGECTALATMTIFHNNAVDGDFVEFVKKQKAAGRNSGTISMGTYNSGYTTARGKCNLYFNGYKIIGDRTGMSLTWSTSDGITTVTLSATGKEDLVATF